MDLARNPVYGLSSLSVVAIAAMPTAARAHASDQAFVLLLPTGVYTTVGVLCVTLTVLLVILKPDHWALSFRATYQHLLPRSRWLKTTTSCFSAVLLLALFYIGQTGARDPLANLAPLVVWTLFWTAFVVVTGVVGNLWRWLNPWSGPYQILRAALGEPAGFKLPPGLGYWPAAVAFLGFSGFLLADPAPSDPARISGLMLTYWFVTLLGMLLFGPVWQRRCECFNVVFFHFARLSPIRLTGAGVRLGWPGWQITSPRALPLSLSVIPLLMLAAGSFDGLNETFWWLGKIGINPLLFPGRSAMVLPTAFGLVAAVVALMLAICLSLAIGLRLAGSDRGLAVTAARFVPTVLPIAFGYHFAHYLPGFLVEMQYVVVALSDPLSNGSDLFGLGTYYVSTSFFFNEVTVRAIWLTQGVAVVAGHVLSIVLAHIVALQVFQSPRRAVLGLIPLSFFMVFYTFFGLWLLAAPKGV